MSLDILSYVYTLAVSIVSSAQPVWDGGIINFFMNKVLFQNATEKPSPAQHFKSTVKSGGYLVGLIFGILWALVLLTCGLWLIIMHCRRKSDSKTIRMYTMLANRIQHKNSIYRHRWQCIATQSILSDLFIIIAIVFCILSLVVNSHLNTSLTSKENENALFPRINSAVKNIKGYVNMFAPHARKATKPIVDKIIYDIDLMQNNSKKEFTEVLTKRMSGDVMAKQGKLLIDYFDVIYTYMKQISTAQESVGKQRVDSVLDNIRLVVKDICSSLERSNPYKRQCDDLKTELGKGKLLNIDFDKIVFKDATGVVNMLTAVHQTPPEMKQKMKDALKKKAAFERKMYLKSKRVLKVEETIRNMTSRQWDDLELKLQGANDMLENVTLMINGDVHAKASKYETLRNFLYLFCFLLMIFICLICSTVFVHHFCFPGDLPRRVRNSTKVALYVSMMFMAITVILCMATFLIGGYSQTEVCRYLEEKPVSRDNASQLHLDKIVNDWLDKHWSVIEARAKASSPMPLPRPRDIFRGLLTSCKANQSILVAINGIDSMDLSSISKPEMTARFLRLGRQISREGLNESNPDDFLRPTMKEDMEGVLKMAKSFIVKSNYSSYIKELEKPLLTRNVSGVAPKIAVLLKEFEAQPTKNLKRYSKLYNVQKQWEEVLAAIETLKRDVKYQHTGFIKVKNHMNISAVVSPMFPAIETLGKFIYNKTYWISVSDELYDEIIVKSSYKNSPKLMAKSTREIMSVLGPCRHLYNAFTDVVFASCATVVQPLNLMWLFFGIAILFLTPSVVIALLLLTKSMGMEYSQDNGAKEKGDLELSDKEDNESKVRLQNSDHRA